MATLWGMLALVLVQMAGASRIQPSAWMNRVAEKSNQLPDAQPGPQKAPSSIVAEHVQIPALQPQAESEMVESASDHQDIITGNFQHDSQDSRNASHISVPAHMKPVEKHVVAPSSSSHEHSLLEAGRSTTATMALDQFLDTLAGKLGLTDIPSKSTSPSLRMRVIVMAVVLAVFLCSCCFCFAGMSRLGGKESSNGRNQYISKNRIIYEWDQNSETITIYTKPPGGISKHNIEVLVWARHVHIGRKGKPPFLKEELYANINPESSTWSISRAGELEIRLQKIEAAEWPCVMLAHLKKGSKARSITDH